MKDSKRSAQPKPFSLINKLQRHQLVFACIVIALCFALGNDVYRAKAIVLKNKDLFPGKKRVVSYLEAAKGRALSALVRSDLKPRYLVEPNKAQPKSMIRAFAGGNTCGINATSILALPYNDAAGTTVGKLDDYNLADATSVKVSGCPTCSGFNTSSVGGGFNSATRGVSWPGTGSGEDAAYRITFPATSNIAINLQPAVADLSVILYGPTCSNFNTDAIAVSNWGYAGDDEHIVVTSMPAGTYHIVVDGYSAAGVPAASGAYTLNVTGSVPTAASVSVSGYVKTARGAGVANAQVSLTAQDGVVRYVRTGPAGAYQFDDVELGQTYIVSVSSRRFQFDSPSTVIALTDSVSDLVFTASPQRP